MPTVPVSITLPLSEVTWMSRVFSTGSSKSLAWIWVVVALSSVDWPSLSAWQQAKRIALAIKIQPIPNFNLGMFTFCMFTLQRPHCRRITVFGFILANLGCTIRR